MIDLKKWRIGEYFRELSIIIIGIGITFYGNSLINDFNTKKSLKEELIALESELRENQREIEMTLAFYHDLSKYRDLVRTESDIKVNADSLQRYRYTLSNITPFNFKKDAFDMLKYSGRLKDIKNQSDILNIMECYRLMEQAKETHDTYMNQKINILLSVMDTEITDVILTNNKENILLYNFITGFNGMEEDFKLSKKQIEKVLSMNISQK